MAKLTPQESGQLFATHTRLNNQMLPSIAGGEGNTTSFNIPKVRLTSKIRLLIEATVNVKHASQTSYVPTAFGPFSLIRRIGVEMNNGFNPFTVSGEQLYLYSLMRQNANILTPATSGRGKVVQGLTASAAGTNNTIRFVADLPLSLNDRDAVGLVLTQNQETTVTVNVDVDNGNKLLKSPAGYTVAISGISITPMVESFSIPAIDDAYPDLSVLKLVQASKQALPGGGLQTFKFPVGTTYRKFAFYVEDANGGVTDDSLTGDIEMLFNQADRPYKINPKILAAINHEQFGSPLPQGMYAFDLSYQGWSNYGSSRDLIDTERLTEMWLQFQTAAAGNVTVVYEQLSRMRQA